MTYAIVIALRTCDHVFNSRVARGCWEGPISPPDPQACPYQPCPHSRNLTDHPGQGCSRRVGRRTCVQAVRIRLLDGVSNMISSSRRSNCVVTCTRSSAPSVAAGWPAANLDANYVVQSLLPACCISQSSFGIKEAFGVRIWSNNRPTEIASTLARRLCAEQRVVQVRVVEA